MLGLGRSALYGQLEAGRLRSLRVGRRRLVPAGAVRDFIEGAGR
jgi:excisionase family DNA binding protein